MSRSLKKGPYLNAEVLLLLLSLVSGCSLILFVRLRLRLLGAVCCFASTAPACVGCSLPLPAALALASVLPFHVVGPRSWACSPSWSVPFWGFLLLFVLLHPFPPSHLFVTILCYRECRLLPDHGLPDVIIPLLSCTMPRGARSQPSMSASTIIDPVQG